MVNIPEALELNSAQKLPDSNRQRQQKQLLAALPAGKSSISTEITGQLVSISDAPQTLARPQTVLVQGSGAGFWGRVLVQGSGAEGACSLAMLVRLKAEGADRPMRAQGAA